MFSEQNNLGLIGVTIFFSYAIYRYLQPEDNNLLHDDSIKELLNKKQKNTNKQAMTSTELQKILRFEHDKHWQNNTYVSSNGLHLSMDNSLVIYEKPAKNIGVNMAKKYRLPTQLRVINDHKNNEKLFFMVNDSIVVAVYKINSKNKLTRVFSVNFNVLSMYEEIMLILCNMSEICGSDIAKKEMLTEIHSLYMQLAVYKINPVLKNILHQYATVCVILGHDFSTYERTINVILDLNTQQNIKFDKLYILVENMKVNLYLRAVNQKYSQHIYQNEKNTITYGEIKSQYLTSLSKFNNINAHKIFLHIPEPECEKVFSDTHLQHLDDRLGASAAKFFVNNVEDKLIAQTIQKHYSNDNINLINTYDPNSKMNDRKLKLI